MTFGGATSRALLLTLSIAAGTAWPNQVLFNGGFEASDLNGWTPFTAQSGTVGTSMPTVVSFYTAGPDRSTMFQAPSGPASLEVNVTVKGGTPPILHAGIAQVVIDQTPVAGYDFGDVNAGQVKATMLDYRFLSDGSSHSISLQFVRPVSSSYSYIDNMWVSAVEQVPEPSTFGLLLAGLGCVMLRHRAARVSKRLLGSSEPTAA